MGENPKSENWRVLGFLVISVIAIGILAAFFGSAHPSTLPTGPASAQPSNPGSISGGSQLVLYLNDTTSGNSNQTISSNFSDSLKKFNSVSELEQWVNEYGSGSSYGSYGSGGIYRNSIAGAIASDPMHYRRPCRGRWKSAQGETLGNLEEWFDG